MKVAASIFPKLKGWDIATLFHSCLLLTTTSEWQEWKMKGGSEEQRCAEKEKAASCWWADAHFITQWVFQVWLQWSHRCPRSDMSHRSERTLRESITISFSLISLFLSSLSSHALSEITDVQSTDVNIALNPRCPMCVSPAASPEKHTQWRVK